MSRFCLPQSRGKFLIMTHKLQELMETITRVMVDFGLTNV